VSKIGFGSNISSLRTQRLLNDAATQQSSISERLASGQRIVRAADDAAGLSIAESLRADARIYQQGIRNLNDGISLLQIGEGALGALTDIVVRQKELAQQSANGTLGNTQRRALQAESHALTAEYNRIISTTSFNGVQVFDADTQMQLQAGYGESSIYSLDVGGSLSYNVGNGTFEAAQSIAYGAGQRTVASADFDGDGNLDIVVAGSTGVSVKLGNGDGTFGSANVITALASGSVVVADINNDGHSDIISDRITGIVDVALGNGNGTFVAQASYGSSLGGNAVQMALGDLNNDGILDIVQVGVGAQIAVLTGTTQGTYSLAYSYSGNTNGHAIGLGDFNSDGHLDMVYGAYDSTGLSIRYGAGNGSFGEVVNRSSMNLVANIQVEDLNHDGTDDIVYGATSGISVFLSNGNGTFRAENEILNNIGAGVDIVDLNGDGYEDILAGNFFTDSVSAILSNGDGTFRTAQNYSTGTGGSSYEIIGADFDNDGAVDIISTDYTANSLTLHRGVSRSSFELSYLNIAQQDNARAALDTLDEVFGRIASTVGVFGAYRSRLETGLSNLNSQAVNYLAAQSRIMDADVAFESAQLIRSTLLTQAASTLLRQVNLDPQLALQLLR
jgi:flagellin-like hook-associated protein FlgL